MPIAGAPTFEFSVSGLHETKRRQKKHKNRMINKLMQ